jgi:hypothetical protein
MKIRELFLRGQYGPGKSGAVTKTSTYAIKGLHSAGFSAQQTRPQKVYGQSQKPVGKRAAPNKLRP